ncbi:copper chaperone CopZ [Kineothrix alysoides]|uniref:Copper chaperone CopZ n=1 Tax=Kineothrix alysoides TaxID=1469948 RepID=A0A4R1R134_9FIRM|nr:cation transporter [Kineothrix alysoides]TCL59024.1 copper chaperone CopZ [Kineothrix alysoides]
MIEITIKIEGMQCGMCEAHLNDAVRGAFSVKKVTSSHSKGRMVILAEQDIDEEKLKSVIENTGYQAVAVDKAPYEKKRIFSALRK